MYGRIGQEATKKTPKMCKAYVVAAARIRKTARLLVAALDRRDDDAINLYGEQLKKEIDPLVPALLATYDKAALEKMWSFVEGVAPTVRRDAPDSWYPSAEGAADPWPHSGWRSFSDMFQDNGAGWLFGDERELLAERVFSKLYGTRELHASKEGFTFHRPTASGRHHYPHLRSSSSPVKPAQLSLSSSHGVETGRPLSQSTVWEGHFFFFWCRSSQFHFWTFLVPNDLRVTLTAESVT